MKNACSSLILEKKTDSEEMFEQKCAKYIATTLSM